MRIIDLSGYMFSGKAAMSDLLKEFRGVVVPFYRAEFDLLRIGGGLIDFWNAVENWSPIRSHSAFVRFDRTVRKLARSPKLLGKLFSTGFDYLSTYPKLLDALEEFERDVTALSWYTPWPYDDLEDGPIQTLRRKIRQKLGRSTIRQYRLLSTEKFLPAAQKFVAQLVGTSEDGTEGNIVVTHNALEPFSPEKYIDLLGEDARCIVVDRDPRDIYATAITRQEGFNDNVTFYRRIAGAHDLGTFIERYRIYRRNVTDGSSRVLRVAFEDMVNDYERIVATTSAFVGLAPSAHVHKRIHFDPNVSLQNVGLWKKPELFSYRGDFEKIGDAFDLQ